MSSKRNEYWANTSGASYTTRSARRWLTNLIVATLCYFSAIAAWPQDAPQLLTNGKSSLAGKVLSINVGKSEALRTTWNIRRVSVAQPEIANVEALGANEVLIIGRSVGETDLILLGENGEVWYSEIVVRVDLTNLNEDLAMLFPRTGIKVIRSRNVHFVTGVLERANQARQLHDFLERAQIEFVDMSSVAGLQQVQLKVRIAEVNRVAIKRMGVNILKAGEDFFAAATVGSAAGGALNPTSITPGVGTVFSQDNIPFLFGGTSTSPFNTLTMGFPGADLEVYIQALAENQYLRLLAEPTLVALSGETASFLAGGEFPIPIVQGTTAGGGTSISIEFKEFGIRLNFTPTVLGDGRIRLHLAPEVSELSDVGAVEIQGFRIPAILTRRSETTLELSSGQTIVMAGLLSDSTSARNSRIPVLGDIPILGSLFRSVTYQKGETELIVLVTATLVEPVSYVGEVPVPGQEHVVPNDWDLFMRGTLEGRVKKSSEEDEDSVDLSQLEALRGPGGWAEYNEKAARYFGSTEEHAALPANDGESFQRADSDVEEFPLEEANETGD